MDTFLIANPDMSFVADGLFLVPLKIHLSTGITTTHSGSEYGFFYHFSQQYCSFTVDIMNACMLLGEDFRAITI